MGSENKIRTIRNQKIMTKITALGDTHGKQDNVVVEPTDILIFTGDICGYQSEGQVIEFLKWFNNQPAKHKVFIAGNHDWMFMNFKKRSLDLVDKYCKGAIYLEDSETNVDGLTIWGSPWSPAFCGWAFNSARGDEIRTHWNKIPLSIDVLVTHGPPMGILDKSDEGVCCGCADLYEAVLRTKPLLHVFGHIHRQLGEANAMKLFHDDGNKTICGNVSVVNEKYQLANPPQVFSL